MRFSGILACLFAFACTSAGAQWVEFANESATRLAGVDPAVGAEDPEEVDYAWADFDKDGDIDLAVARKEPFTIGTGKRVNGLWMNEDGIFVDRSAEYASETDVEGDQGFLTPTNDRDILAIDVDNDGWIDLVTAPALTGGDPKHIGHPRVYRNLGREQGVIGQPPGPWRGFRFENDRIPTMTSPTGQAGNPCLCHVAGGDVNGDGYADLWLIDYDSGNCVAVDFENKLLLNQGAANPGYFVDVTETSFFGSDTNGGPYPESAFGASGKIVDLNDDGHADLIKQFASHVGTAYNDDAAPGTFDRYGNPYDGSAYFMNTADLNNDDRSDIIISDDGGDRYLLNQGPGSNGNATFQSFPFSFSHSGTGPPASDDGFGGNSLAADLDKDGLNDVIITDVDVDISGCSRRTHIYRNLGITGSFITLQEQTTGANCANFQGNPATCLVASIPADMLEGTHDVAIFDINGDTWPDMVLGRCDSTEVWINQVAGAVPTGAIPVDMPEQQLLVSLGHGSTILSWGASCSPLDTTYSVYRGNLGSFGGHTELACDVPQTEHSFAVDPGNHYYLVAPSNDFFEGLHGASSVGLRQPGPSTCKPQVTAPCE